MLLRPCASCAGASERFVNARADVNEWPPQQDQEEPRDAAPKQGPFAIRGEFHGLRAASRCRMPLFRGPEILPSRGALLCPRRGNRRAWKERFGTRSRARTEISVR